MSTNPPPPPTFKHGAATAAAKSFEDEIKREDAEIARIEQRRADRDHGEMVFRAHGQYRDAVAVAQREYARKVAEVDRVVNYETDSVLEPYAMGLRDISNVAGHFSDIVAIRQNAGVIKKALEKFLLTPAQANLREFELANAGILKHAKYGAVSETPGESPKLPLDYFSSEAVSKATAKAVASVQPAKKRKGK